MRKMIGAAVGVGILVAACSSSSGGSSSECFAGTYDVTWTQQSGNCGTINVDDTLTISLQSGEIIANLPVGATAKGGTFDENTCHGQYAYTYPQGCPQPSTFSYDLQFTSTGYGGTASISVCYVLDGGSPQNCSGVYAIHGVKKS